MNCDFRTLSALKKRGFSSETRLMMTPGLLKSYRICNEFDEDKGIKGKVGKM